MFRLSTPRWKRLALLAGGAFLGLAPLVYAQEVSTDEGASLAEGPRPGNNTRTEAERRAWTPPQFGGNQMLLTCLLTRPGQVHRFALTCPTTRQIDARVADCCVVGDHWEVKVKTWDTRPNTAVASAPGGSGDFSAAARVFTYTGTRDLHALIECRYLHGTTLFPAEADILVSSYTSTCTAQDLGVSDEI